MSALPAEFDPLPAQAIPALPVPVAPVLAAPTSDTSAAVVPALPAPASDTPASDTPASGTPAQAAPQRPGGSPRRPGSRARPISRRPRPGGVRACSAVSRAALTAAPQPPVPAHPAVAAASPWLRLTGRGRSAVAACAVVVATLLWFAIATAAHASAHGGPSHGVPAGPARPAMTRMVVQPGQTLWSIATQADPSADPRLVVQRIVSVNKLTSESLAAGQRLWVPGG